ncbi:MAG: hypothetical protein ACOC9J_00580 [Persicimonas sp.]
MDREELVRLAGEKLANSIFRDAPPEAEGVEARPYGQMSGDEVRFFVYQDVLDELAFAAGYRDEPSFAVLLGAFAVDDRGPFLEVTGFSRFQYTAGLGKLYQSLKPELDSLVDELSGYSADPPQHVVGLFVGARGSGGKLPAEVARVHLSLFNVPYQVAAIVDPDAELFGLHARAPASKFYNSPFWTVERLDSP